MDHKLSIKAALEHARLTRSNLENARKDRQTEAALQMAIKLEDELRRLAGR